MGGGWENWRTGGETESYHLPRFPRSREKILVPPPRAVLLGHLLDSLWSSISQPLPKACPRHTSAKSTTVWSNSKSNCNPLTSPLDRAKRTAEKYRKGRLRTRCNPWPRSQGTQQPSLRYEACSTLAAFLGPERAQHLLPMSRALSTDIFSETRALERPRPLSPLSPKG